MFARIFFLSLVLAGASPTLAEENTGRWWPAQKIPAVVVRVANPPEKPASDAALQMLIQSISGLAANAVNEGRGNELVWVQTGNPNLDEWFKRFTNAHSHVHIRDADPWELVDRYSKQRIIKGYLLFRLDKSRAESNANGRADDCSVNVATSLAGVLDGIIVAEELEEKAKAQGLKLLLDARDKTQSWCFEKYKDEFTRQMLFTQDPRKPHARDLAIAHKTFTVFGNDKSLRRAMAWLEPLSPILGWNSGDEFANTDLSTRHGHIQTATDWCMNLPVLMAGTETNELTRSKNLDPAMIDWNDKRNAVSFILTDGDNVQWLQGNFFFDNAGFWSNPQRGKIPYGWSSCFTHLAQLCPQAIEYAAFTRSTNDSFIEWGGGYYYPDHFGMDRTNRWQSLAQHARRTWGLMKKTNCRAIGFNFARCDSVEARKACETFAAQTDELLAIFAFQYYPYEGGAGKIFWVKDRNSVEIPVITARYSIWEHSNQRERSGTPAKVAREIRETVNRTASEESPRYDWVIAHAWSYFKKAPGSDEDAENMPQEDAAGKGGERGYLPAVWCADRLSTANVRVVSPEELAWRIRMKHDPAQTKKFINQFDR